MNNVAIQGELGSFHHAAAIRWFGKEVNIVPCTTFKDVFIAMNEGLANKAIVAIENSLFGSINEVYDLLLANNYFVVGEIPERIHQCLIGFKQAKVKNLTHVYSHPVALSQCSNYLDTQLKTVKKVESFDTAASVEYVKRIGDINRAAIASKTAAKLFEMQILKEDIQDNSTNFTRFLVLDSDQSLQNVNKASLVIETTHKPGALYEVLKVFKDASINLSKLQSRPIPGKLWRYMFYIDIEANLESINSSVANLNNLGCSVRLLGTYKASTKTTDI